MSKPDRRKVRGRKQANELFGRMFKLLKSRQWTIKLTRVRDNAPLMRRLGVRGDAMGAIDTEKRIMWIDFREDVLTAVMYVCVHALHLGRKEWKVIRRERHLLHHMDARLAVRLWKIVAKLL